ncbi:reverse transcriptase [Phytophthora megakarya]|uniref:Reverse transcriptase n=1 Tax=Phytophthora megakarya TaxID=4795 RepID=A0A225WRW8_9STRA|nr:reverse transcriptase [Phytophthora megakarya]
MMKKDRDEELSWANLKTVLRIDEATLTYWAARDAWKIADRFVLSENGVLYYLETRLLRGDHLQEKPALRLVVPTTMIQEVLQNCHDSLEGGHQGIARTFYRVKLDYYWIGLYADTANHVRSCPDCSSSNSRPKLRGYLPGNVLAGRLFQIVSMAFVIPLPEAP